MRPSLIAIFLIALATLAGAPPAAEARDDRPDLRQIRAIVPFEKALAQLRVMERTPFNRREWESMRLNAANVARSLIRVTPRETEDRAWADLTSDLNRCVDLVLQTCGSDRECGDSYACGMAVEWLDLYNDEPTEQAKYEFEFNCIAGISDDILFPACQ